MLTQRDELQKDLEDATMRYDIIKTANSKKDSSITSKDKIIEEKKARINSILKKLNATASELSEAKQLIASLNGDIEGYKTQIESLEGQKFKLTQEKQTIATQRDEIKRSYDSSVKIIRNREGVIDVGSTLHASNFKISGITELSKGREKETTTAKNVDKLRISFDLDENMITSSGEKILYIVITDPEGNIITQQSSQDPTINTREGAVIKYTQKLIVDYIQNKSQTVSFDWKQVRPFAIGNYKIEVYNNGFKVGEGTRPFKKGGLFG